MASGHAAASDVEPAKSIASNATERGGSRREQSRPQRVAVVSARAYQICWRLTDELPHLGPDFALVARRASLLPMR